MVSLCYCYRKRLKSRKTRVLLSLLFNEAILKQIAQLVKLSLLRQLYKGPRLMQSCKCVHRTDMYIETGLHSSVFIIAPTQLVLHIDVSEHFTLRLPSTLPTT